MNEEVPNKFIPREFKGRAYPWRKSKFTPIAKENLPNKTIDGKVSAVKFQDGRPMIEVDGQLYDLEQLLSINLPAENVMPTEGYRNIVNPMIKQVQHNA